MTISSLDHYDLLEGWTTKDYQTLGTVRQIYVYLKHNRNLSDPVTVEYKTTGVKEEIDGTLVHLTLEQAQEAVENDKQQEVVGLELDLAEIQAEINLAYTKYDRIYFEEDL